ncbi:MAG: dTDP-4-dehydrorhamnose reductase [Candidatus Binatia bacterium]
MRIVITGGRGHLGADLALALRKHEPIVLDHAALDVSDPTAVAARISELAPAVVVNTAAYNKVDLAEDEPDLAWQTNALAPRSLAAACDAANALFVHFSTDYVFGAPGTVPWREDDAPTPTSVYATTKLAGEHFARRARSHVVIRTCGLYGLHGAGGKGTNFVETMLRVGASGKPLRVVDDQVLAPTATRDLAALVAMLLERWRAEPRPELLGIHHATNAGATSWFEFAREIFHQAGLAPDLQPTSTQDYGARAARPSYSVLANTSLQRAGLPAMRPWQEALAAYLAERATRG